MAEAKQQPVDLVGLLRGATLAPGTLAALFGMITAMVNYEREVLKADRKHRVDESGAKVLITADGAYRGGKIVPLKSNADTALETSSIVEKVVVVRRTGDVDGLMRMGRDVWWHAAVLPGALVQPPARAGQTVAGAARVHPGA